MINKNFILPKHSITLDGKVMEAINVLNKRYPELVEEFTLAAIVYKATKGEVEISDNEIINVFLSGIFPYSLQKDTISRDIKMRQLKLEKITELYCAGHTQKEIGEKLGISQQTVSHRLKIARMEFPELVAYH